MTRMGSLVEYTISMKTNLLKFIQLNPMIKVKLAGFHPPSWIVSCFPVLNLLTPRASGQVVPTTFYDVSAPISVLCQTQALQVQLARPWTLVCLCLNLDVHGLNYVVLNSWGRKYLCISFTKRKWIHWNLYKKRQFECLDLRYFAVE